MAILIFATVICAVFAVAFVMKSKTTAAKSCAKVKKTTYGEMERLNTLLRNIEAYDGGQKRGER